MTTRLADDAVSIAARLKEIEAERAAALTRDTQPYDAALGAKDFYSGPSGHLPPLEPWDYAP